MFIFFLIHILGSKGEITNSLIQENYHMITLNLTLGSVWFGKKKLD